MEIYLFFRKIFVSLLREITSKGYLNSEIIIYFFVMICFYYRLHETKSKKYISFQIEFTKTQQNIREIALKSLNFFKSVSHFNCELNLHFSYKFRTKSTEKKILF